MSPIEKWRRLSNPQTVEDYGLSMTLAELQQVPEAVDALAAHVPAHIFEKLLPEKTT